MAIIKKKQLKEMSKEDLQKKLVELKKELVKVRSQISKGTPPENPGRTKEIKRTIARIKQLQEVKS